MPKTADKSIDKTIELLLEGLTPKEVGEIQGIAAGTVKKRRKAYNDKVEAGKIDGPKVEPKKSGRQFKRLETGPSYTEKKGKQGVTEPELPNDVRKLKKQGEDDEAIQVKAEVVPPDDDDPGAGAQTVPEGGNVVAFVRPSRKAQTGKTVKPAGKIETPEALKIAEMLKVARGVELPTIQELKQVNWMLTMQAGDADTQKGYMSLYLRLLSIEATLPPTDPHGLDDWDEDDRDAAIASLVMKYATEADLA